MDQNQVENVIEQHTAWLRGVGGRCANLSGANLSYANLSRANLSRADLSYANLSYANLSRAGLSCADLSDANLSRANLSGANLSYANLSRAGLSCANLSCANLSDANLSGANLSDADLSDANLSRANLSCADLSRANLSRANLSGANLSGAQGLPRPSEQLKSLGFKNDSRGLIVYKTFGAERNPPAHWTIAEGQTITEVVNHNRQDDCGCGVNVGTLKWVEEHYGHDQIWELRIPPHALVDIIVPWGSDGKIRCAEAVIIRKVSM